MFRACRLLVAIGSCVIAFAVSAQSISAINAQVEVVDSKNQTRPSTLSSSDVTVKMPLIAGSIFGSPNTGHVLIERAQIGTSVDLDIERLLSAGARLASPVESKMAQAGLVVEPRNARFARFGTFVFDSQTDKTIGFGGFIDRSTRTTLVLVYFDEPCRISGSLRLGALEAEHNIVVRSGGLHWIRVKETAANRYELDNFDATRSVILGIQPPPQARLGQGA